jgi:hypothetical protein
MDACGKRMRIDIPGDLRKGNNLSAQVQSHKVLALLGQDSGSLFLCQVY